MKKSKKFKFPKSSDDMFSSQAKSAFASKTKSQKKFKKVLPKVLPEVPDEDLDQMWADALVDTQALFPGYWQSGPVSCPHSIWVGNLDGLSLRDSNRRYEGSFVKCILMQNHEGAHVLPEGYVEVEAPQPMAGPIIVYRDQVFQTQDDVDAYREKSLVDALVQITAIANDLRKEVKDVQKIRSQLKRS